MARAAARAGAHENVRSCGAQNRTRHTTHNTHTHTQYCGRTKPAFEAAIRKFFDTVCPEMTKKADPVKMLQKFFLQKLRSMFGKREVTHNFNNACTTNTLRLGEREREREREAHGDVIYERKSE